MMTFAGALALKSFSASTTPTDYTSGIVVSWDAEAYDTNGFHDNTTNNSRLTVPSGVTKVRVGAAIRIADLTADQWVTLSIMKNGSSDYAGNAAISMETGFTTANATLWTAVLDVTPGDYFELFLQIESDTSVTTDDARAWFAIEVIE